MRIALAILCLGAVTFLMRVMAAFIKEARIGPSNSMIHFAKFNAARQRRELIEMNPTALNQNVPRRAGERERIAF